MNKLHITLLISTLLAVSLINIELFAQDRQITADLQQVITEREAEWQQQQIAPEKIAEELELLELKLRAINDWPGLTAADYVKASMASAIAGLMLGSFIYLLFFSQRWRKVMIALVAIVLVMPAAWRTYTFATSSYMLIGISSLDEKSLSLNPYSKDGAGLLNPSLANWIFINLPQLHSKCKKISQMFQPCDRSLIPYIAMSINPETPSSHSRQYLLLENQLAQGEDIDSFWYGGYSALHNAVISYQPQLADFLLAHGADPYLKTQPGDSSTSNLDAFELLQQINDQPEQYHKLELVLEHYRQ